MSEEDKLDKLRTFAWSAWGGSSQKIEGVVDVAFGPAHVVFYGPQNYILRAVRVENVIDLHETSKETPA